MVVGLLGNKSPDSNRFTLVTPKPENGVRLQATLGNQNPTGLPVGVVSGLEMMFFVDCHIEKIDDYHDEFEIDRSLKHSKIDSSARAVIPLV